jgi:hypothetical protein
MHHLRYMNYDFVARLLKDPRVQASVNVQSQCGDTAFHHACRKMHEPKAPTIIQVSSKWARI